MSEDEECVFLLSWYLWLLLQSNTLKRFSFRPFTIPQVLRRGKQAREDVADEEEEEDEVSFLYEIDFGHRSHFNISLLSFFPPCKQKWHWFEISYSFASHICMYFRWSFLGLFWSEWDCEEGSVRPGPSSPPRESWGQESCHAKQERVRLIRYPLINLKHGSVSHLLILLGSSWQLQTTTSESRGRWTEGTGPDAGHRFGPPQKRSE